MDAPAYHTRSKSLQTLPLPPQLKQQQKTDGRTSSKTKSDIRSASIHPHHHYNSQRRTEDAFLGNSLSLLQNHPDISAHSSTTTNATTRVWSTPIFLCSNLSRYVTTLFCPCTVFFEIFDDLVLSSNSRRMIQNPSHSIMPCCCTLLSYVFFPFLYVFNKKFANAPIEEEKQQLQNELEEEEGCCPELFFDTPRMHNHSEHSHLFDYIYSESYDHDTTHHHYDHNEIVSQPPSDFYDYKNAAFVVCLASGCMIPATCMVRQIASQKYADIKNNTQHDDSMQWKGESLWTSGVVSCLAWPCALVQVEDEIKIYRGQTRV